MSSDGVASDEIDVRAVAAALWTGRRMLAGVALAFTLVAVAYAVLATPIFRSQALVQVREDSNAGKLGALSQLGSLVDLAGISMGSSGNRSVFIASLKSRSVVSAYLQENNLLPRLYHEDYDADAGKWESPDPTEHPTLWKAYDKFMRDVFRVSEDKKTELVTVAVEWEDPAEAQLWATGLIAKANAHLKAKAAAEAEANLAYLRRQVEQTSVVPLQQALYTLVESEQKKLMLAQGSAEFGLVTIDPADLPERKVRPRRLLIVLAGMFAGALVGALVVLVRRSFGAARA